MEQAKYIIKEGFNGVEFTNVALSLSKCYQIHRIMKANRSVRGYVIMKIDFDLDGLKELEVFKEGSFNYDHLHTNHEFIETAIICDNEIEQSYHLESIHE